ncbi:hypothetical protein [Frankia sp. AgB32]|uniref:hypothetical protein n=1 Tax=Frankia sp. AgB32 TaxID=631119 RepID=UPI00200C3859|nr:hypothetical protein [Frankia sp. AgB32]MCK9894227.1 hypothetical protein [Frankia sp. AgB32]
MVVILPSAVALGLHVPGVLLARAAQHRLAAVRRSVPDHSHRLAQEITAPC